VESEKMQRLNVELFIPIPKDQVLISRVELDELKKKDLEGVYWTMRDLENRINKKSEWIKEKILYPAHFRKILDVENGGFVYFPKKKGETWSFQARKMAEFLDQNFYKIFRELVS
jgi:phage pi2 protein 07